MTEKSKRILLVDDNIAIHEDFKQILKVENIQKDVEQIALENDLFHDKKGEPAEVSKIRYDIDDAYQGEEAIEMVDTAAANGVPYALIFMDVRMPPGIDGLQTIQRIWEKHPNIEMVICTAHSDYSWEDIMSMFGTTDHLLFIKKPFNSVSIKQIALTMTTKWELDCQNKEHIATLESRIAERTKELEKLVKEKEEYINEINDDLTLAEIVQQHLLPVKLPELKTVDIAALYIPAAGIGGDLYDIISINESTYAFLIFDVSGHGIAAALITSIGKFSFRQHLQESHSPETVMSLVNNDIYASTPPHMFITAFLVVYNTETGEARYTSAGHNAQFHYRAASGEIEKLKEKGFFLGIHDNSSYESEKLIFSKGDKLILYTDGLTETCNKNNDLFGPERVMDTILDTPNLPCEKLLQDIMKKNEEFRGDYDRLDDLCLVVIDAK